MKIINRRLFFKTLIGVSTLFLLTPLKFLHILPLKQSPILSKATQSQVGEMLKKVYTPTLVKLLDSQILTYDLYRDKI